MKTLWPNGIPKGMPNHLTGGLPNDYREANEYSTEVHNSTEPRWELTIDIYSSRQRSNKFSKNGEIAVSNQSSPTNKSKAY